MKAYKLFLKLLLAVNLLVFYDVCALESEEFRVYYFSNENRSGGITLNLTNDDGSAFVIGYNSYVGVVNVYLELNNDREIELKTIDLNGESHCIYGGIFSLSGMTGNHKNGRWYSTIGIDFENCKLEWRELIKKAKGNLKFNVECIEVEGKLERKYTFKVSAANLSRMIDIFEVVY
ncbi:hypothetical protein BHO_0000600 (plasmid) [Borrelia hermsii YBT]|uniref:hypothetical protein n=1 Tax=Borrelia hermsii TaxID=140 RepID=UPI0003E3B3DF|nr:hypothetical protein [Borrelia hermsii]AHH12958.1 hypothetical protein BHO_0000600 [Borrelia hermsii YBT]